MKKIEELLEEILEELRNISEKLDDIGGEVEQLGDIEGHLDDLKTEFEEKFELPMRRKAYCGPGEYRRPDGTIGKVGEKEE